jgi:hypothetical protein
MNFPLVWGLDCSEVSRTEEYQCYIWLALAIMVRVTDGGFSLFCITAHCISNGIY